MQSKSSKCKGPRTEARLGSLTYEDATGWLLKRCLIKENRTSDTIMTTMTGTNSYCGFTMCLALTI